MSRQETETPIYEGCGNRVLIVHLDSFKKNDSQLRKRLAEKGLRRNVDSVMVLTGNPLRFSQQGFHVTMDVFEPRGNDSTNPQLAGSWSTMCGNGIRAVTRYLIDQGKIKSQGKCFIKTRSGILPVEILPQNQFKVCMGQFSTSRQTLKPYVKKFKLIDLVPRGLALKAAFVGLNGNKNGDRQIDGEPHLVLVLKEPGVKIGDLEFLAQRLGPGLTTNRKHFPLDINTNMVSIKSSNSTNLEINAATFERGIEYVTKACGTGATVIGSWYLNKLPRLQRVKVNMPGGKLEITKKGSKFYLRGPANQANN